MYILPNKGHNGWGEKIRDFKKGEEKRKKKEKRRKKRGKQEIGWKNRKKRGKKMD